MLLLLSMLACGDKSTDTSSTDTTDTSVEDTSDTEETVTEDTQEEAANAESLQVGDIVITEIMKNPCGVTGSEIAVNGQGEEYLSSAALNLKSQTKKEGLNYNASDAEINLNGLIYMNWTMGMVILKKRLLGHRGCCGCCW